MLVQFRTDFVLYCGYLRPHAGKLALALFFALARGIAAALFALTLRDILNVTVAAGSPQSLWPNVSVAILLCLGMLGCGLATRFTVVRLTQSMLQSMRLAIIAKLMTLSVARLGELGRAHVQSLGLRDTDKIDAMTNGLLGVLLPAIAAGTALAAILMWISPVFGGLSLLVALLLWLFSRSQHAAINRNIGAYASAFAAFNKGILMTLERLDIVRASGMEALESAERKHDSEILRRTGVATDYGITFNLEILALIGNAATVGLLALGAVLAGGGIALHNLLSIYLILLLIRSQAAGARGALSDVRMGAVSLQRIGEFLGQQSPAQYSGRQPIAFRGNIRLERVSYRYGQTFLFEDLDFVLPSGACVGITGPNGSGKTTLLHIILGTIRPVSGLLSAEGVSYPLLDLATLREATSFLPQEPVIFDGTIQQNIAYGHPAANQRDIEHAADLAGALGFITATADGFATQVGDSGTLLSGGEKQRIALARALLGQPQLLIMDEPSNHLDADAIPCLLDRLARAGRMPTVLIVSHDRSLLAKADTLYELRDAKLTRLRSARAGFVRSVES